LTPTLPSALAFAFLGGFASFVAWRGLVRGEVINLANRSTVYRVDTPARFWLWWTWTVFVGAVAWVILARQLVQFAAQATPERMLVWLSTFLAVGLGLWFVARRLGAIFGDAWRKPAPADLRREAAFRAVLRELDNDAAANFEDEALVEQLYSGDTRLLEAVAAQLAMQRPPRRLDVALAAASGGGSHDAGDDE
jgi:hypothetical protein